MILWCLFKGYKANTDSQLRLYLAQKINEYNDEKQMMEEELINLAENKYKTLVKSGGWCAPNEDQKEVLVLRAQIEDINKKKDASCNAKRG